ncbi:MAG: hypothetical protein UT63_C0037G0008 [Candidatus Gottesmanbacteria bacterium GW2011_GWC2_39_8]|uniref:SpoVT-AbrB domain-containing protein n=1 Tax=Candidatus Gottesmanbacteria bacterium GW2011_GWC2_39_8 TaxID=1618450 RepID=A0A0G0PXK4_9BACT|nr:MAG: hypothetical protein UT63_C0037G0008 [Candidatus Gottesmanbacteria bacterium GW2011_GWC2_39_8]
MTYTLTVSSQGQIIIPNELRKYLGIHPKDRLKARSSKNGKIPVIVIEPPVSWIERVKGIAKGVYGKGEDYIEKERQSWEK